MERVMKAVIPAAGLGTRFLPATKAQPKEMLPIINIPAIQYVVEEAVLAGIDDILIITGKGKRAIEDHFDLNHDLERKLIESGKAQHVQKIRGIAESADIYYIRQKEQRGLGDAIRYAEKFVGSEPFAVLLGDDIIVSETPCTAQLISIFDKYPASVIGVERLPREKIASKGIISPGKEIGSGVYPVTDLVEKPRLDAAPSDLGIAGRYILTPGIFECLKKIQPGINNELQLTDALKMLLMHEKIYACKFSGKRYDIGNQLDLVKTTIEFALEREDMRKELVDFIRSLKV
ncbi:MAG: UTP--glucose-1-phosphate uridylyltransferase GalU [Candidatus Aenigmarchaeota archaeon]|nr:UTP--glucose-1-phosphate uridylyltransferase GalU [Candidatus Aenigmarchaeota archaeon]